MSVDGSARRREENRGRRRAVVVSRIVAAVLALAALALLGGCLAEPGEKSSVTPSATVSWSEVETLFQAKCELCHPPGGGTATTSLDYTTLSTENGTCVPPARRLVIAKDRYASCLYVSVTGLGGRSMASYLSVEDQELIGNWIDSGAPGP